MGHEGVVVSVEVIRKTRQFILSFKASYWVTKTVISSSAFHQDFVLLANKWEVWSKWNCSLTSGSSKARSTRFTEISPLIRSTNVLCLPLKLHNGQTTEWSLHQHSTETRSIRLTTVISGPSKIVLRQWVRQRHVHHDVPKSPFIRSTTYQNRAHHVRPPPEYLNQSIRQKRKGSDCRQKQSAVAIPMSDVALFVEEGGINKRPIKHLKGHSCLLIFWRETVLSERGRKNPQEADLHRKE